MEEYDDILEKEIIIYFWFSSKKIIEIKIICNELIQEMRSVL